MGVYYYKFEYFIVFLAFELSPIILLAEHEQMENSLFPLSLNQLEWTFKPWNLKYLPLLLIVILGFHFGMSSIITDQFFIPEFIYDTIIKTPSFLMVYTIVSAVALCWIFMTNHPVLANQVLARNIWERGNLEILSFLEI